MSFRKQNAGLVVLVAQVYNKEKAMSKYNVGDKVRVVHDFDLWLLDNDLPHETILTVVEEDEDAESYINADDKTIEIECVSRWHHDFEKVEDMFFAGCNPPSVSKQVSGRWTLNTATVLPVVPEQTIGQLLGVYRPNLEDRKVGKVPVHMVIDGFPLSLVEISKVMGWARDVKGYELHDWRNIPDADNALSSAGYRHMLENSIQKSKGLRATERVDDESRLIHLAHQAFNLLAEMELILSGKIQ